MRPYRVSVWCCALVAALSAGRAQAGWNNVFQRFRRWAKKGVWERVFNALIENPDFEYLIIDSTIVRAHQHAAGAKGGAKMRRSGVRAAA